MVRGLVFAMTERELGDPPNCESRPVPSGGSTRYIPRGNGNGNGGIPSAGVCVPEEAARAVSLEWFSAFRASAICFFSSDADENTCC